MNPVNSVNSKDLDRLNSFLRGEISAVETYRIAIEKLDKGSTARGELETCRVSHLRRVDILRSTILSNGGEPADGSGPWGVLTKAIEGGATVFGDKAAIAALEQGEDHGLADYLADCDKVEGAAHELVMNKLIPAQEETHQTLSALKKRFKS